MIKNSTRFLVIHEPEKSVDIIDVDELLELTWESRKYLDSFFNSLDYSPSEEVISRILAHAGQK